MNEETRRVKISRVFSGPDKSTTSHSSYLVLAIEGVIEELKRLALGDKVKISCNHKEGTINDNQIEYEGRLYSSVNQFGVYTIYGTTNGSLSEKQYNSIMFIYDGYGISYQEVKRHVSLERKQRNNNLEKMERFIRDTVSQYKKEEDKSLGNIDQRYEGASSGEEDQWKKN